MKSLILSMVFASGALAQGSEVLMLDSAIVIGRAKQSHAPDRRGAGRRCPGTGRRGLNGTAARTPAQRLVRKAERRELQALDHPDAGRPHRRSGGR